MTSRARAILTTMRYRRRSGTPLTQHERSEARWFWASGGADTLAWTEYVDLSKLDTADLLVGDEAEMFSELFRIALPAADAEYLIGKLVDCGE